MRWRFALKFLATFAAIVPAWWAFSLGEAYRDAVHLLVQWTSPVLTGWWLDTGPVAAGGRALFRRGSEEMPLLLNLPAIAMSLMPLTSLLVATPGQRWLQLAARLPVAVVLCLGTHVAVVLAYPWIIHDPGPVKETVGVFSGLVAFVVAPLAIWFGLTYPTLRGLWGIEAAPGRG